MFKQKEKQLLNIRQDLRTTRNNEGTREELTILYIYKADFFL